MPCEVHKSILTFLENITLHQVPIQISQFQSPVAQNQDISPWWSHCCCWSWGIKLHCISFSQYIFQARVIFLLFQTDDLIQATLREAFKECTVLTIAHRISTIMDYDKIIVMKDGQVAEYDNPMILSEDKSSIFHSMCKDANIC